MALHTLTRETASPLPHARAGAVVRHEHNAAVLFQAMNASYIDGGGDEADDAVPVGTRDDWMCHPKRLPPRIVWNRIYKTGGVPLARFLWEAAEHHGWT